MCILFGDSEEAVCPPREVLSGKQLSSGVDHSQIDTSPPKTQGYCFDTDDNFGYITDYVLDSPLRLPPSKHPGHPIPPAAHGNMEVRARAQAAAFTVVLSFMGSSGL